MSDDVRDADETEAIQATEPDPETTVLETVAAEHEAPRAFSEVEDHDEPDLPTCPTSPTWPTRPMSPT